MDGFYDTNPNGTVGGNSLPTVDRVFQRRTYSEELGETAVLSSTLLNNVRLQFQLASPITAVRPGDLRHAVPGAHLERRHLHQRHVAIGAADEPPVPGERRAFDGARPSPAQLRRRTPSSRTPAGTARSSAGPFTWGSSSTRPAPRRSAVCESQSYLGNIANVATYTQSYGNASYTVNDALWSLFVQDDYQVRPDLTINLGLRYEQQTFTDSRHDFAPRVGFSYNWRGDGKTVIRGGFGIYYSQIVDNAEANYALTGPTGVFNYTAAPGQIGFPASVAAAPLPALPAGAAVPLRSLYIRPGDASYYNQFFPTSTLIGYPNALLNPILGAVESRHRAQPGADCRRGLDFQRGLRGRSHAAHHSPAGRGSAGAVRPHRARPDAHGAGGQLHATLLDLVVRAERPDVQLRHRHQSAAAVFGDSDRRKRRLPVL